MKLLIGLANGITISMSMVCMSFLYRRHGRAGGRTPVASVVLVGFTAAMFGVQLLYPEIVGMLQRDLGGLRRGEWWRLLTPLFVQTHGWGQFVFNMIFLGLFLPIAERLYGARTWMLFFVSGVAGQVANYGWLPVGGGSSTAAFGVMGALLLYVLRHRGEAPRQYPVFAAVGLCGAVALCALRDGHGAGMLAGALVAALL